MAERDPKPVENAKEEFYKLLFGIPAVFAIAIPAILGRLVARHWHANAITAVFVSFVASYVALPLIVVVLRVAQLTWLEVITVAAALAAAIAEFAVADVRVAAIDADSMWRWGAWLVAASLIALIAADVARKLRSRLGDTTGGDNGETRHRVWVFGGIAMATLIGALASLAPLSRRTTRQERAVYSLMLQDSLRPVIRGMHTLHDREAVSLIQARLATGGPACATTRRQLAQLIASAQRIEQFSHSTGDGTLTFVPATKLASGVVTVLARLDSGDLWTVNLAAGSAPAGSFVAEAAASADCRNKEALYYDALQVADWRASLAYTAVSERARRLTKELFATYQPIGTVVFVVACLIAAVGLVTARSSHKDQLAVTRGECVLALAVAALFASPWIERIDEQSLDVRDPSALFAAQTWYAPRAVAAVFNPVEVSPHDPLDQGTHPPAMVPDTAHLGLDSALKAIEGKLDKIATSAGQINGTVTAIGTSTAYIRNRVREDSPPDSRSRR